jgi:hypothetical protein
MHKDLDGKWNRIIALDSIRASGVREETGSGVTEWIVAGPLRVLETRDPNSGLGSDDTSKPRWQYVATEAGILSRHLPPESVGDVWREESAPRPFAPCDPSDFILELLGD